MVYVVCWAHWVVYVGVGVAGWGVGWGVVVVVVDAVDGVDVSSAFIVGG